MPSSIDTIRVGARSSPLSRVQVEEIKEELDQHHPGLMFEEIWVETSGDHDQKTSLRKMEKTDFFTRELDAMLAVGLLDVTFHSAKDLPEPLHPELEIVAITKGVDSSDSLVLPEGETLESLPSGAHIATSSERREEMVRSLRSDLRFVDVRGTIEKRLAQLQGGRVDGVVIAEAALIRLGLTDLNRITLPGETVPHQGQLAVVVRKGNTPVADLFRCLDSR